MQNARISGLVRLSHRSSTATADKVALARLFSPFGLDVTRHAAIHRFCLEAPASNEARHSDLICRLATKTGERTELERFNLSCLRWYSVGMKPTSNDLRRRVVAARVEDGQSMGQIAERFRMPKGTVQNIIERYRDAGTVEPKPHNAGRKPAISGQALRKLERDVLQHSDATLCELRDRCGLDVSLVTVHNTLKRRGFTRKKRLYVQVSSADETSSQREGPGVKD